MLRAERGELAGIGAAGAMFFFVLFGYFMIRPVREAMGVERGLDDVRVLFYFTAGVSLLVAMAFGGLVHRLDRRRFLSVGFLAVIVCLGVFATLRAFFGDEIRGYTGRVFYVWLSVVNMFMVGVFWSFMADIWSPDAARRLFPAIAVGGTLGAIAGASVPWWLSERLAESGLMLLAASCFAAAIACMLQADRLAPRADRPPPRASRPAPTAGLVDGVRLVATSPYLLGLGAYIALIAVSSTVIYFTKVRLVADASEELTRRIALFAQLDLLTQIATLLVQLFVTGRLIRWIGVGWTLAVMPIVTVGGFAGVHLVERFGPAEGWTVFGAFALFQALHRASRHAVARPARETLFAGLSRDETYKAKPVVDLFVYRGGDVAGARLEAALVGAATLTFGSVALAAAPVAALWLWLGVWLARAQGRRIARRHAPGSTPDAQAAPTGGSTPAGHSRETHHGTIAS